MADTDAGAAPTPKKRSKLTLVLVPALALLLGAGAFYAMYSGRLDGLVGRTEEDGAAKAGPEADVAFVPLDPLVISLGPRADNRHLRFEAELEVDPAQKSRVAKLMPRILDILNGYLRAVELTDLEEPSSLIRLRGQMLRRVQMVAGEGRVRDLLITEFVVT